MASDVASLLDEIAGEHGLPADSARPYSRAARLAHVNEAREEFSRAFPRLAVLKTESTFNVLTGVRSYAQPSGYLGTIRLYRIGDDGASVDDIVMIPSLKAFRWYFPDPTKTGTVRACCEIDDDIVVGYVPTANESLQWVYYAIPNHPGDGDPFDQLYTVHKEAIKMRALVKSASWIETPPEQLQRWRTRQAEIENPMVTRLKSLEWESRMLELREHGAGPVRWES